MSKPNAQSCQKDKHSDQASGTSCQFAGNTGERKLSDYTTSVQSMKFRLWEMSNINYLDSSTGGKRKEYRRELVDLQRLKRHIALKINGYNASTETNDGHLWVKIL